MSVPSTQLVDRWRSGDEAAARELYDRYAERLIALVKTRLSLRLGQRLDPEDLIQSVFRNFFARARDGRYVVRQPGDLWHLLLTITRHKVQSQAEYHSAARRAVGKEDSSGRQAEWELASREPTPADAAALADLLVQSLARFNPTDRSIIELRLQGHLLEEIVSEVGRCRLTVIRVLDRFKRELCRLQGGDPEP